MPPKEAKVWSIAHASVLLLGLETEHLGRGKFQAKSTVIAVKP